MSIFWITLSGITVGDAGSRVVVANEYILDTRYKNVSVPADNVVKCFSIYEIVIAQHCGI